MAGSELGDSHFCHSGRGADAFLVRRGSYVLLRCLMSSALGVWVIKGLHTALICLRRADRLTGRSSSLPTVVASLASMSTNSFSCIPTRAGHQTNVIVKLDESCRRLLSVILAPLWSGGIGMFKACMKKGK